MFGLTAGSVGSARREERRNPGARPEAPEIEPASGSPSPWTLTAVFLWALLLRLVHLRQISSNPFFTRPIMDPLYHDQWAQNLANHWGARLGPPSWGPQLADWDAIAAEPFFRAPAYPYFLAAVYWVFGHDYLWPRIIQAVLGSLSCVLVYLITRRLFGERAALLAGAVAGAYGMLIYFDGELLLPVLEILGDLLLIWLLLRAADSPRRVSWWLAGIATGFSALVRPNVLLIAVAVGIWIWIAWRRAGPWSRLLPYGVGVLMLVLPVTVRNVVVGGDLVLIASQGGINFYLGNNPRADGWSATAPELPRDWGGGYYRSIEIAEESEERALKPSEVSRYWYGRGLSFLRQDPGGFLRLWGRKLYIFWLAYEFGNNQIVYFFRRYAPLLRLPLPSFGVVAPLALAGMVLFTRDRRRALLTLFVLVYMASIVAFFVNDKLRLPVVPMLVALAAAFVVWWVGCLRQRRLGPALVSLLLVAPSAVVVNHDLWGIARPTFASSHAAVASIYLEQDRLEEAEGELRACLRENPTYPDAHRNLGYVLYRQGRLGDAEAQYRLELGESGEEPFLLAGLGELVRLRGEHGEARELFLRSLELGHPGPMVRYQLGLCFLQLGELLQAEREFRWVLAARPEEVPALFQLGVVEARLGRYDDAIRVWEKVLSLDSTFVLARDHIEAARENRMREGPEGSATDPSPPAP